MKHISNESPTIKHYFCFWLDNVIFLINTLNRFSYVLGAPPRALQMTRIKIRYWVSILLDCKGISMTKTCDKDNPFTSTFSYLKF